MAAFLNDYVSIKAKWHYSSSSATPASELLADIEKDGAPILITQHGLPAAYLVDVEAHDALQKRIALLEGVDRGERAVEDGRVVTRAQAKQRMSRWLK